MLEKDSLAQHKPLRIKGYNRKANIYNSTYICYISNRRKCGTFQNMVLRGTFQNMAKGSTSFRQFTAPNLLSRGEDSGILIVHNM